MNLNVKYELRPKPVQEEIDKLVEKLSNLSRRPLADSTENGWLTLEFQFDGDTAEMEAANLDNIMRHESIQNRFKDIVVWQGKTVQKPSI